MGVAFQSRVGRGVAPDCIRFSPASPGRHPKHPALPPCHLCNLLVASQEVDERVEGGGGKFKLVGGNGEETGLGNFAVRVNLRVCNQNNVR